MRPRHSTTLGVRWKRVAGRALWYAVAPLLAVVLTVAAASAQGSSSGVISGTVKDESGGALPGVTATLTSPDLQLAQMVTSSDAEGNYRFAQLPVGTYKLTFELAGFNTLIREGLRLTVGFQARVDAVLKLGGIQETVTVTGQAPVIDVTQTATQTSFTKELLAEIPRGQDMSMIYSLAPGIVLAGTPDVGGSNMANRQDISTGGVALQPRILFEGMNIVLSDDLNSGVYFNSDTINETTIKSSGNDAETNVPGMTMVAVVKSGGNAFHSVFKAQMESPKLQADNLDDALRAKGIASAQPIRTFRDWQVDLGGRILRDKLWFYDAYSTQNKDTGITGFVSGPGPDGRYLTGDEPIAYAQTGVWQVSQKYSYQLSPNNSMNYVWQHGNKFTGQFSAGALTPLEATTDYVNPTSVNRGEYQHIGRNTVFDVVGGYVGWWSDYSAQRQADKYGFKLSTPRLDQTTNLRTGSATPNTWLRPQDRKEVEASYSILPQSFLDGRHDFKLGVSYENDHEAWWYPTNAANIGDLMLVDQTVSGVPNTPVYIRVYNLPVYPSDKAQLLGVYFKDTWRATDNLTLNLGVRWDYSHTYMPAQHHDPSPDFPTVWPAVDYAYQNLQNWTRFSPRAGMAWNGGNAGVFKAFFGTFGYVWGAQQGAVYNSNAQQYITYRWHDLNGDNLYQAGEVNLDPNGADFVSVSGGKTNSIDSSLKQPLFIEASGSYERQLMSTLGFTAAYVYRHVSNQYTLPGSNALRPASAYSVPLAKQDPGPDGVAGTADDGAMLTLYDYDSAYKGINFVRNVANNNPNPNWFHTLSLTMTKRPSKHWQGSASIFWLKNHRWTVNYWNAPQDAWNRMDTTWTWAGEFNFSVNLPRDIMLATSMTAKQGIRGSRTVLFTLPNIGSQTVAVTPYGSVQGPAMNVLNFRAQKSFKVRGMTYGLYGDLFNVLNSNAPNAYNLQSGPSYQIPTGANGGILPARVGRVGVSFKF
jgi:hypothetical protein